MARPSHLSEVLTRYVNRVGYTSGQLARLSGIPKATIVNWMEGRVKHPRGSEDLIELAVILHLDEEETTELLLASGHPSVTEHLDQALKQGDARLLTLLSHWSRGSEESSDHAPFQAIADLPHFVGRKVLIEELASLLLSSEQSSIYTLQGMGGVGKTALAAHIAYQLRPHLPDGVLWARADTSDPMSILSTFARAYGHDVSQYADLDSRSRVVRELMANKRALMVLDNVESSSQIEALLPPSGKCAVLITTRQRNLAATRGSRRFLLSPFDKHGHDSLRLFSSVLGEERAAAEQQTLLEIAEMLGHLPLAIDIVASRLAYEPGWSAANFLRRLQEQKRRLQELAYEQQNVILSFQLSFAALNSDERRFFAALGVLTGEDFSVETATFVSFGEMTESTIMDAEDILRRLFGLSLVRRGRAGRFRQHPLLRDFAYQQLVDGESQRRMVTYFEKYIRRHERDYSAMELEYDSILSAFHAARELEMWSELLSSTVHSYHYLEARGLYDVAAMQLGHAERVARRLGEADRLVFVLRCQGRIAERRGHYGEAERIYEEGLLLARQFAGQHPEDSDQEAVVSDLLRALGVLASLRGDYALAEAYYQEGLLLARQFERRDTLGSLLRGLGVEAFTRGDYPRAEALFEEGLALPQATGARERQGALLWALGMLAEDQGNLDEAESYLMESAELARELGHLERLSLVLYDLGVIAREQGKPAQAERYLQQGLAVARDLGHPWRINRILVELGELALRRHEWRLADDCFGEVSSIAREQGSLAMAANALFGLARSAYGVEQWETARRLAGSSLEIFQRIGHHRTGEVKGWLAMAAS